MKHCFRSSQEEQRYKQDKQTIDNAINANNPNSYSLINSDEYLKTDRFNIKKQIEETIGAMNCLKKGESIVPLLQQYNTLINRLDTANQGIEDKTLKSNIGNVIKFNPKENSRTYYFPDGSKVELKNVVELIVRDSGTHRVKTEDGKLHIVPTGWNHIEIDASDWTV